MMSLPVLVPQHLARRRTGFCQMAKYRHIKSVLYRTITATLQYINSSDYIKRLHHKSCSAPGSQDYFTAGNSTLGCI